MKKFITVVALASVSLLSGCVTAPSQMTSVDLCVEYGRAMAAGDVERAISVEGTLTSRKDISLNHCKMYAQKGVRNYHASVELMQNGIRMMNGY